MTKIGAYDLLPLVLRQKDSDASGDLPGGPILQQILAAIQEQIDSTAGLIEGLRGLINLESTSSLILALLTKALGSESPQELPLFHQREYAKELVNSYKIKGLVLSWIRMMKLKGLGNYNPVELYKGSLNETVDYSASQSLSHPYRAARVLFTSSIPYGLRMGAVLESVLPWEGPVDLRCTNHSGLVPGQLSYPDALSLVHDLQEVVPIQVLPPVPICTEDYPDWVKETCDGADGSRMVALFDEEPSNLIADDESLTLTCTGACQLSCQTKCAALCELSCKSSCEPVCQARCEHKCQNACMFFCQEACEQGCEDPCQSYCQDTCQSSCQSSCRQQCQQHCQGTCQSYEETCKGYCQAHCQTSIQYSCQDACELACQTPAQLSGCTPPGGTCSSAAECGSPPTGYQGMWGSPNPDETKGCLTTAETCQTISQTITTTYGPCNLTMELPHSTPPSTSDPHASPSVVMTGAQVANVEVVIYGEDSNGHPVAYWGVTNREGLANMVVPPGHYTVMPLWYDYPPLTFSPSSQEVDFISGTSPTVNFTTSWHPGSSTSGTFVAMSRSFCGWYGELPVNEPKTASGYHREPHNAWARVSLDEALDFLVEAGIDPNSVPGTIVSAFRNYGQIVFSAPDVNLGEITHLMLYDRDYRYAPTGEQLIGWSPLVPHLYVYAHNSLKIPHRSQVFYLLLSKRVGRKKLGDQIAEQWSVTTHMLEPTICETTCQLICQEACTTGCQIQHLDYPCTSGCTSWCTGGCTGGCTAGTQTCEGGTCQLSCTGGCTTDCTVGCHSDCTTGCTSANQADIPKITLRAERSWNFTTDPRETSGSGKWYLAGELSTRIGGWDPSGYIYSELYRDDKPYRMPFETTITWRLVGSWKEIFGIPDNATVVGVRFIGMNTRCLIWDNVGVQDFVQYGAAGVNCNTAIPSILWWGRRVFGVENDWLYMNPGSIHGISEGLGGATDSVEFMLQSLFHLSQTGGHARIGYNNLTLEVRYQTPKTTGCTTKCQASCETECETGCASHCEYHCQDDCQTHYEGPCTTYCETHCESDCQELWAALGCGDVQVSPCGSRCQQSCQYNCQANSCETRTQLGCSRTCQTKCQMAPCQTLSQYSSCVSTSCETTCMTDCQYECENVCQRFCQGEAQVGECMGSCQLDCQTTCQKHCQTYYQYGGSLWVAQYPTGEPCETTCQSWCQPVCQSGTCQSQSQTDYTGCLTSYQGSCQVVTCQTQNQFSCVNYCETWKQFRDCISQCQVACQVGGLESGTGDIPCKIVCQYDCQALCELTCQAAACETRRETDCHTACEAWNQVSGCTTLCQGGSCQSGCEPIAQVVGCSERCQSVCEAVCQLQCQIACEATGCQLNCQVAGCQVYAQPSV